MPDMASDNHAGHLYATCCAFFYFSKLAAKCKAEPNNPHNAVLEVKYNEIMAEMKEELSELGKGKKVIFKLLPLLLTARDGKTNGELKEALHL